ncbi:hypothetical protein [Pseudothermotoga thermarum]|uniref:DUF3352 domain-containing protein n=1 Tax=Pseudothermotoga thermarum DSM 5069 TaxID=688269 RepID=F7YWI9_9THEM|nr:hypothetical protein [Pseudothermotoga thermarum]AEH51970.1 hypothetical protein Theth_1929 [Pseudothermotoga thermarum DSM 5069]
MRKFFVAVSLCLVLVAFGISRFIPGDYESVFIARSNGKYYDQAKSYGLIKILAVDLGLEPMIQSLLASYGAQYGVTTKDIDDLLRKDLLIVQNKEDIFVALGPSPSAGKFVRFVSTLLGQELQISHKDDYLLISTSKELLDKCLKGGGSVPKEVMNLFNDERVWAVSYSPGMSISGAQFSSKGFVKVLSDRIYCEQILIAQNDAAKSILKQLTPSKNFELVEDQGLSGEVFAFVNISDPSTVRTLFDFSKDVLQLSKTFGIDVKAQLETFEKLIDKFGGKAALSMQAAEIVESFLALDQSKEQKEQKVKMYAVMRMKTTLQELKNILGGEIQTFGKTQYLRTDDFYVVVEKDVVRLYTMPPYDYKPTSSSLEKAKQFFKSNEMSLFVFIDFDPILDKLLGITTGSAFVLYQSVENDLLKTIWYLK